MLDMEEVKRELAREIKLLTIPQIIKQLRITKENFEPLIPYLPNGYVLAIQDALNGKDIPR